MTTTEAPNSAGEPVPWEQLPGWANVYDGLTNYAQSILLVILAIFGAMAGAIATMALQEAWVANATVWGMLITILFACWKMLIGLKSYALVPERTNAANLAKATFVLIVLQLTVQIGMRFLGDDSPNRDGLSAVTVIVHGMGYVPLLLLSESLRRVSEFVESYEARGSFKGAAIAFAILTVMFFYAGLGMKSGRGQAGVFLIVAIGGVAAMAMVIGGIKTLLRHLEDAGVGIDGAEL